MSVRLQVLFIINLTDLELIAFQGTLQGISFQSAFP